MKMSYPAALLCLALAALSGCESTPDPAGDAPAGGGNQESGPAGSVRQAAPSGKGAVPLDTHLMSAEDLEEELRRTRAGKLLLTVLRAHGGWDAWRSVLGLSCRMERVCRDGNDDNGEAATATEKLTFSFERRGDDGRWYDALNPGSPVYSAAGDGGRDGPAVTPLSGGLEEESFLLRLPFSFFDRRLNLMAEYIGVELVGGASFAKVRFSPPASRAPFPCTAYFDTTTHLLSRLLLTTRSGEYALLSLSGWSENPDGGIRFPTERKRCFLDGRYAHPDLEKPDCEERLLDVRLRFD